MFKNIVIGFDGSAGSRRALDEAIRLALLENASLSVVTIEELPRYPGTIGEVIEEQETVNIHIEVLHKEASAIAGKQGLKIKAITRIGHPAKGLVDYIQETKPDLLIIGHTGQSAIWGSFLGTTADRVIRHAICSVLVVR